MCKCNKCVTTDKCCTPVEVNCGCKVKVPTNCVATNIDLPHLGVTSGRPLDMVLDRIDLFYKDYVMRTDFREITNIGDGTDILAINLIDGTYKARGLKGDSTTFTGFDLSEENIIVAVNQSWLDQFITDKLTTLGLI